MGAAEFRNFKAGKERYILSTRLKALGAVHIDGGKHLFTIR